MAKDAGRKALEAGSRAPGFELDGTDGKRHSLSELLARGPVLLALYKTGCPTCQLALPFLDQVGKGSLQVVGISQDNETATKKFYSNFGLSMLSLFDRENDGYRVSNAFGISLVPSLFVVEQDGKISSAGSGFSKQEVEALGKRAGVDPFQGRDHVPEWKAG